jgi:uncharacterized membrane protein
MQRFLKDNWTWILAPIVLVIAAVIIISIFTYKGEPAGFEYPL